MFDPPMEMPGSNELARAEHELATLRALYAEAVRLVKELEDSGWDHIVERRHCPICYRYEGKGHKDDCKLAAVLSRPEAQEVLRG